MWELLNLTLTQQLTLTHTLLRYSVVVHTLHTSFYSPQCFAPFGFLPRPPSELPKRHRSPRSATMPTPERRLDCFPKASSPVVMGNAVFAARNGYSPVREQPPVRYTEIRVSPTIETRKARPPTVDRRQVGTSSCSVEADLSVRRCGMSETRVTDDAR